MVGNVDIDCFFVNHLPLFLSCTLDTTCNKILMILLAMLILWLFVFFLAASPLSLSCIFDTIPDMMMLLLLVMLRLIACWHFSWHFSLAVSLFSCTLDTTLTVMLVTLLIMLILIIYWHFFLVVSLLYLTLFTPHLLWCWSCCWEWGWALTLNTHDQGVPGMENLVSNLVVDSCPPALPLWNGYLLAEHNSGLLQGVRSCETFGECNMPSKISSGT